MFAAARSRCLAFFFLLTMYVMVMYVNVNSNVANYNLIFSKNTGCKLYLKNTSTQLLIIVTAVNVISSFLLLA